MNLIKKYLIIFSAVLSLNSMAIEQSAYEAPNSCTSVVEAGKKLAADDTTGFSSETTLKDFVSCNLEMLPTSLSTEIMYSIFGESIIIPLSNVNSFITSVYTKGDQISITPVDNIEINTYLKDRVHTFPVLTATIEALTFASFQLISFMLGLFSLMYLVSTMTEGTYLGKQVNTFWTFIKIAAVMALIFPLDGLGLNIVQLVIIFIAFCGSLLASLIWSILPLFKYAYLNEFISVDDELKISKDTNTIEISEFMIKSSICDISSRQATLLKGYAVSDFKNDILSSNDMYKCLTETTPETLSSKSINIPYEHAKTAFCAKKTGVEYGVDCGNLVFSNKHNEILKLRVINELYSKARNIAVKTISANCTEQVSLQKGEESNYYTYCSNLDQISFNTDFKGENILSIYPETIYSDSDYKTELLSIKDELEVALMQNLTSQMINNEDVSTIIMEKISFALNKGWFNAGTFLFDMGDTTNLKNIEYESIMTSLSSTTPEPTSAYIKELQLGSTQYSTPSGISYSKALEERYQGYVAKGSVESIRSQDDVVNIFEINKDLDKLGLQEDYTKFNNIIFDYKENLLTGIEKNGVSTLNGLLFPTLILGFKFNEPTIGGEESCSKDYSNCKKMPINPIATIIDSSRTAASTTGFMLAVTGLTKIVLDKYDEKAQNLNNKRIDSSMHKSTALMFSRSASLILGFISIFLSINMLISILAGYILPVVLFIYFIGNALSWILSLIIAVTGSTLWLGLHLMPSKEDGFAGHAKKGYLIIMDVFLKPVFLVLGVFGAFILSTILIVVFNTTFEIVMSTFSFFDAPESPIELFYNFLLNFIYVVFLIIIFFKSAKAVYKIPNALENWVGLLAYEDASMWKEVTNLIERTFLSGIKKFLIFS